MQENNYVRGYLCVKMKIHAHYIFQAGALTDHCIYFYNHQRIQLKTEVAPLALRHFA